ncbi:MAG: bifunctional diaminohydroxyphosphoribosylaminopyrimidine deaminase/5-amino-6-(5-phosphoribosylamino)uracil reductase RibD [Anaerovorax sp.]
MHDNEYMKSAIQLAKKGCGFVSPNPLVGAVIVKNGEIIGKGYHEKFGQLHAERNALANCRSSPKGATMYVTLEPCCHYGKTPPCTEALIESGIAKVCIGSHDPNPLVSGKGVEALRAHGIEVVEQVLKESCDALNPVFFHYVQTGLPFVIMKYAMTMDGKIATYTGDAQWITGEEARRRVHEDRHRYTGIMVGIGTVLSDDPLLTCRIEKGKNPIRIICDTHLRTPLSSQLVKTAKEVPTIIGTCCTDMTKQAPYLEANCRIITVSEKNGTMDLHALMVKLGKEKIDSILLEGGGALNWSALESGLVNSVQTYLAPKLFGGLQAKSPVSGLGVPHPDQAFFLKNSTITQIGSDILIESEVVKNVHGNY